MMHTKAKRFLKRHSIIICLFVILFIIHLASAFQKGGFESIGVEEILEVFAFVLPALFLFMIFWGIGAYLYQKF
jgi:hypothetical protein